MSTVSGSGDTGRYRRTRPKWWIEAGPQSLDLRDLAIACYLQTGPQTSSCGLMRVSPGAAAEDLRIDLSEFNTALARICAALGWKWDSTARVLWIPEWLSDNRPQSPSVVVAWRRQALEVPDSPVTRGALHEIGAFVSTLGDTAKARRSYTSAWHTPAAQPDTQPAMQPDTQPDTQTHEHPDGQTGPLQVQLQEQLQKQETGAARERARADKPARLSRASRHANHEHKPACLASICVLPGMRERFKTQTGITDAELDAFFNAVIADHGRNPGPRGDLWRFWIGCFDVWWQRTAARAC